MALTPEQIIKTVDQLELERSDLHFVMDRDMELYEQQPYGGLLDDDGQDMLQGYAHFTSNDPTTVMDLALHLGSITHRNVRVDQPRSQRDARERDNLKEMCALGVLNFIDQRRAWLLMPRLQDSMFAQSYFRGRVVQRVLWVKEELKENVEENQRRLEQFIEDPETPLELLPETRSYVDVTDWDPRNVYWVMGPHGLLWACEKSWKTREEIKAEYDVDVGDENDTETLYAIYDYLDEKENTVITEETDKQSQVLKQPTPHGMVRGGRPVTPVAISMAEYRPYFQTKDGYADRARKASNPGYGQGLFHGARNIFDEENFMFSVNKELSHRAINPGLIAYSRDGSMTLPGDPRETGEITSLSTAEEQDIKPLPPVEILPTALNFMGMVSAQRQRATFPSSAYGELSISLSGVALNQLRQSLEAPITPHTMAVGNASKQMLDILVDSYATGNFGVMSFEGRMQDVDRSFFQQEIPPEELSSGGIIEVEMIPQLPQDDVARASLVSMLREAPMGVPLIGDRFARELMKFQDVEQIEREVWEQLAQVASPIAKAWGAFRAAYEQGDQQLAEFWAEDLNIQKMQQFLQTVQLSMMGQQVQGQIGQNGSAPSAKGSIPSQVLPPQMRGMSPTPNPAAASQGASSQAGQARPGAQSDVNQQLNSLGLFGPNG